MPALEIANAARLSRAELVLLSCFPIGEIATQAELEQLSAELPITVRVLVGGRAAPLLGRLPPRLHRLHSLTELEGRLSG